MFAYEINRFSPDVPLTRIIKWGADWKLCHEACQVTEFPIFNSHQTYLPSTTAFKLKYAFLFFIYFMQKYLHLRLRNGQFSSYLRHWCWNVWKRKTPKTYIIMSKNHHDVMQERHLTPMFRTTFLWAVWYARNFFAQALYARRITSGGEDTHIWKWYICATKGLKMEVGLREQLHWKRGRKRGVFRSNPGWKWGGGGAFRRHIPVLP